MSEEVLKFPEWQKPLQHLILGFDREAHPTTLPEEKTGVYRTQLALSLAEQLP
jgi:hypothetical protein